MLIGQVKALTEVYIDDLNDGDFHKRKNPKQLVPDDKIVLDQYDRGPLTQR